MARTAANGQDGWHHGTAQRHGGRCAAASAWFATHLAQVKHDCLGWMKGHRAAQSHEGVQAPPCFPARDGSGPAMQGTAARSGVRHNEDCKCAKCLAGLPHCPAEHAASFQPRQVPIEGTLALIAVLGALSALWNRRSCCSRLAVAWRLARLRCACPAAQGGCSR